jgi:hypothetical protein
MENNELFRSLPKEDQDKIKKEIEERFNQFKKNESRTLNDVEWKDLVWPSIKRMNVSNEYFRKD